MKIENDGIQVANTHIGFSYFLTHTNSTVTVVMKSWKLFPKHLQENCVIAATLFLFFFISNYNIFTFHLTISLFSNKKFSATENRNLEQHSPFTSKLLAFGIYRIIYKCEQQKRELLIRWKHSAHFVHQQNSSVN